MSKGSKGKEREGEETDVVRKSGEDLEREDEGGSKEERWLTVTERGQAGEKEEI